MNIWYGTNENAWLSNLAERRFKDRLGREYVSVEHAYQSWKSGVFDKRTYCKPWSAGTKFVGKPAKKDNNWNLNLMQKLVLSSFKQNPELWQALCATAGEFTHNQDKGIWKREFPRILRDVYRLGLSSQ